MTGTVIVGAGAGDDDNTVFTLPGNILNLQSLIEGGEIMVYDCGTTTPDDCPLDATSSPTKSMSLVGLRTKINDAFLGDNATSIGLIQKWASGGPGMIATPQEQAISVSINHAGSLLRRLAVLSPAAASTYVGEISGALALMMLEKTARDMINAAQTSFASSRSSHATLARDLLSRSRVELASEAQSLRSRYGDFGDLTRKATELLEVVEKNRYMLESQVITTGGGLK